MSRADRPGRDRRHRAARHVDRAGLPAGRDRGAARRRRRGHLRTASGLGAGRRAAATATGRSWSWSPCRPTTSAPRSSPRCRRTDAVVTDVGSIKSEPARAAVGDGGARAGDAVRRRAPDGRQRAVGTAGGERRPVRRPTVGGHAARRGSTPVRWRWSRSWHGSAARSRCTSSPGEHDRAVARISHLPHLLAVLVAGRLAGAPGGPPGALRAGRARRHPGGRAATRRCGSRSSPSTPTALRSLLAEVREELDVLQRRR